MRRYYFHTDDGFPLLDETGTEFTDMRAVRDEAIRLSGDMLREGADVKLWDGALWRLWVTESADGKGDVLCELHFSAVRAQTKQ